MDEDTPDDFVEPEQPVNDPEGAILHPVEVLGVFEAAPDEDEDDEVPPWMRPIRESAIRIRDDKSRTVTIFIGPFEAMSILQGLAEKASDRPLSHDLLRITIDRLGAEIQEIVIDDIWQGTFFARIRVKPANAEAVIDIDARPSDAIALAVRTKCPVFMAERVLREAGIVELDD